MDKPWLYITNSFEAQADGNYVLNKHLKLLQTNKNCVVLDVGCGPGNVTYEKILPLLPSTTKKIIGVDVSHNNIEYARKNYQMDPRIYFEQLDILTDEIPAEYVDTFDLILSLSCLHFVGNHRKAFENMYKMLKPGGTILISFAMKSLLSNMYQYIYDDPKWSKYMNNFNNVVYIPKSEEYYMELFEEIEFKQIQYEQRENKFRHLEDSAFDIFKSLNLFNVPKCLEKEFIEKHLEYFQNHGFVLIDNMGRKEYCFSITVFIMNANKSL